jgi:hypothetical protein
VCLPYYLDLKAQLVINKCHAIAAARPKEHQFVSSGQTQVLRFYYYYEYYKKSQLTAISIHELFTSQAQSSLTYLQNSLYTIYFIYPSVSHKTIYTLYYANTGLISLAINQESMRYVLLRFTIFSLSGLQLKSKTQASFTMEMQDVFAIPLETRICRLLGSKLSQVLAAFIQCLRYSPHYLKTK